MPCFHPLRAFRDSSGVRILSQYEVLSNLTLPCGKCDGCLMERSRQWSIRIMHEASCNEFNSFITLTYDEANLPPDGGLHHRHFQLFMKRLRKTFPASNIRYFMCGEYGGKLGRPHFHAILFGHTFTDLFLHMTTPAGSSLFRSETLERLWPFGFSSVGAVTIQSAAYVARYTLKKSENRGNYETVNIETGEIFDRRPEYVKMSNGSGTNLGGIGKQWFDKFSTDVFPHDRVVNDGTMSRPPRYYDKLLKRVNPDMFDEIKTVRAIDTDARYADNTPSRLASKEIVAKAVLSKLKRTL